MKDFDQVVKSYLQHNLDKAQLREQLCRMRTIFPPESMRQQLKRLMRKGHVSKGEARHVAYHIQRMDRSSDEQHHRIAEQITMPDPSLLSSSNSFGDSTRSKVGADTVAALTEILGAQPDDLKKVPPDQAWVGTELKGRFMLLKYLGQGGMGAVYRARDRLKFEADDEDPFVAIKILTRDFSRRSGSYRLLQQEASNSQRLSHPNIATVFDFDRDGAIVFMTMELLHGRSFDRLLVVLPDSGLPLPQAMTLIAGMCEGLAYAHERQVVHYDFKPGNIFLTEEGTVKLLDFGIARAMQEKKKNGSNAGLRLQKPEFTALTPAYATLEMFEHRDPDPRDDIYALGCVCYELLTKRHPFSRLPMPEAKAMNLKYTPVRGLNRSQQRTLRSALEFERELRCPSVHSFLIGMKYQRNYTRTLLFTALLLVVLGAALFVKPMYDNALVEVRMERIQVVRNGDQQALQELLRSFDGMQWEEKREYAYLLRKEILAYFQRRMDSVFSPENSLYNYAQAIEYWDKANAIYIDSATLEQLRQEMKGKRDQVLAVIESQLDFYHRHDIFRKSRYASSPDQAKVIRNMLLGN